MKSKKRLAAIALSAGIGLTGLFGLTACGGAKNTQTSTGSNQDISYVTKDEYDSLKQAFEDLNKKFNDSQDKIKGLEKELSALSQAVDTITQALEGKADASACDAAILALRKAVADLSTELNDKDAGYTQAFQTLNDYIAQMQAKVEALASQNNSQDVQQVLSSLTELSTTVNMLKLRSALQNTFLNNNVEMYVEHSDKNASISTMYHCDIASNGDYYVTSVGDDGAYKTTNYNGMRIIKYNGTESVTTSSSSVYGFIIGAFNSMANGEMEKSHSSYTITSSYTQASLTIDLDDGRNVVTGISYEDDSESYLTRGMYTDEYVQQNVTSSIKSARQSQFATITYYNAVVDGVDAYFGNRYIKVDAVNPNVDGGGSIIASGKHLAVHQTQSDEDETLSMYYTDMDGGIAQMPGSADFQEIGDDGISIKNKEEFKNIILNLLKDITSISYNAQTGVYTIISSDDFEHRVMNITINADGEIETLELLQQFSSQDMQQAYINYTFTTMDKAEFTEEYAQIQQTIQDYINNNTTGV